MAHRCFKCGHGFRTSGELMQHMREIHSSFVENAQMRIDRSKDLSLQAKAASGTSNSTAKCPFCMADCMTRKKLMRHLEVEHQDGDETDVEPEVKIIRVADESKDKIFGQLKAANSHAGLQPTKYTIVNNILNALGSNELKKELSLPGTSDTIKVSTTSIKLPEKRYRCFWCEASFRKRGKLMDHIDMFHKASKEQTEVQAEMLHGSGCSHSPPAAEKMQTKVMPPPPQEQKPSTAARILPPKYIGKRRQPVSRRSSTYVSTDVPLPDTPNNKTCKFICIGRITEVSNKAQHCNTNDNVRYVCTFFNRKADDPLPRVVPSRKPPGSSTKLRLSTDENIRRASHLSHYTNMSPQQPPYSEAHLVTHTAISQLPEVRPSEVRPSEVRPSEVRPSEVRPSEVRQSEVTPNSSLLSPTFFQIAKPQPIHPMFGTAMQAYQQKMTMQSMPPQLYLRQHQQHQQQMRLLETQQQHIINSFRGYNYSLPSVHDPDAILDLTLPKYV